MARPQLERLKPYYSDIGWSSLDPELMIRLLIVGYCYASGPSAGCAGWPGCIWPLLPPAGSGRQGPASFNLFGQPAGSRFRESDILRHIFERVVSSCMAARLVKGDSFAVDASVMEANASR